MLRRRAKRAVIWNILYYLLSLFCTFYLMKKEVIANWDVVLVFLPLVLVAISTETISVGCKILRPYNYIDLLFKLLAYVSSQLIYRHIAEGVFFVISIIIFAICAGVSLVCSVVMLIRTKE